MTTFRRKPRIPDATKLRIARDIANVNVRKGNWTQEQADEFMAKVRELMSEREEGKARDA